MGLPHLLMRNRRSIQRWICVCVCVSGISLTWAADPDAENTKRNQGSENALTPIDQSNNQADIDTAASIRSAINGNDRFSTNAKNIKIIVTQRTVTLRGPVENADERARIEAIAKSNAGARQLDNQLTIKN